MLSAGRVSLNSGLYSFHQKHILQLSAQLMSTVSSKKTSNITLISINRPNKVNALNLETLHNLQKSVLSFENDNNSRCAILYGQGGNFCSGFDLLELHSHPKGNIYEEFKERPPKKPIIAAVSGYAVGQGLDLALWCDLRYVEENALMGFYNKRFGIPTCHVTIKRLRQMIGQSRTMNMLLEGKHISTCEALDWGLCNKMVSCGTAVGEAAQKATRLSRTCQEALLADRAALLSQCETIPEEWTIEEKRNTDISFEKSKALIEQFVNGGHGRHGAFRDIDSKDKDLDFLYH